MQVPLARDVVYATLADPHRRPHWIRDLKRVVPQHDGRDQWVMHGPMGSILWEVEQTIQRAPTALGWCMTGDEGAGYMRFDLVELPAGGTRITVRRFLGFRTASRALDQWWGHPGQRLQGDMTHLLELLRAGPGPQVNAVGFRPTASGLSQAL